MPDTQGEAFDNDPRMQHRFEWLVDQRESLDLRVAAQVGDFTGWGWDGKGGCGGSAEYGTSSPRYASSAATPGTRA